VDKTTNITDIIAWAGGSSRFAEMLGVSLSAVSQWASRGAMPPMRAIQVERISEGRFRAIYIRKIGDKDAG